MLSLKKYWCLTNFICTEISDKLINISENVSFISGNILMQATVGAPEDGIMTADLLEQLFMEKSTRDAASKFNAVCIFSSI